MLQITEIYKSIQGESTYAGLACIFIRLTGCNLRCSWCDTEYGFNGGEEMTIEQILNRVEELDCSLVEVTGGEPLMQDDVTLLVDALLKADKQVLVETGGHLDIDKVSRQSIRIVDMKCPASKMTNRNDYKNLSRVTPQDEVKFVIQNKEDFSWAKDLILEHKLENKCKLIASPVFGKMNKLELAELIIESKLNIRMQLQMHKLIWEPDTKGV